MTTKVDIVNLIKDIDECISNLKLKLQHQDSIIAQLEQEKLKYFDNSKLILGKMQLCIQNLKQVINLLCQ